VIVIGSDVDDRAERCYALSITSEVGADDDLAGNRDGAAPPL